MVSNEMREAIVEQLRNDVLQLLESDIAAVIDVFKQPVENSETTRRRERSCANCDFRLVAAVGDATKPELRWYCTRYPPGEPSLKDSQWGTKIRVDRMSRCGEWRADSDPDEPYLDRTNRPTSARGR
jgi:hypothetical protein